MFLSLRFEPFCSFLGTCLVRFSLSRCCALHGFVAAIVVEVFFFVGSCKFFLGFVLLKNDFFFCEVVFESLSIRLLLECNML